VLDQVTKVYDNGVLAVDDVSLRVDSGELLVLLGPSGCGKTTLLRIIAGLEEQTAGDVWLSGQIANELPPQKRNVAMVFQDGALYPHLTVRDNLAFPLHSDRTVDKLAVQDKVREMAHGLSIEQTLDRRPSMLSGGERQRVAMGRALIRGKPAVLLMDEPLASLDVSLRSGLRAEISALLRSLRITTVYVTHDQVEALSLADRIVVLRDGAVEDVGTPDRVYHDPRSAFVAAFLGSPPVNLAWATIWVINGDRVVLDFGGQHLDLAWTDPRSEPLTPYHGMSMIVGIRPEALTPWSAKTDGSRLCGRVSSLEYHGHEWMARLEVGFRPVDINEVRMRPQRRAMSNGAAGGRRGRKAAAAKAASPNGAVAGRRGRKAAAAAAGAADPPRHHGAHRGTHLLVRLDSPKGWASGQQVAVAVDVPNVYVFDGDGRRVDSPLV